MEFLDAYLGNLGAAEGTDNILLTQPSENNDDMADAKAEETLVACREGLPWEFNRQFGSHNALLAREAKAEDPNLHLQKIMAQRLRMVADVLEGKSSENALQAVSETTCDQLNADFYLARLPPPPELLLPKGSDSMIYNGDYGVRFRFRAPWAQLGYVVVETHTGDTKVLYSMANDRKSHMVDESDDESDYGDKDNDSSDDNRDYDDEGVDDEEEDADSDYEDDEYDHYDDHRYNEEYEIDEDNDAEDYDDVETFDDTEDLDDAFESQEDVMDGLSPALMIGLIARSGHVGVTFAELMQVCHYPDEGEDADEELVQVMKNAMVKEVLLTLWQRDVLSCKADKKVKHRSEGNGTSKRGRREAELQSKTVKKRKSTTTHSEQVVTEISPEDLAQHRKSR
eukprot:scaffold7377_cov389-Prasinococcus_capsulatus_cf.AAC.4